ncbi:hypothetical protein LCGC14_2248500, partial [marine sediment metagenome]
GVYVEFKSNAFKVIWKKVPRGTFGKIWDFIKSVVSFIIETIQDMFALLKGVACLLAQTKLNEVAQVAQKKKKMDANLEQSLSMFGIEKGTISKLRKSSETGVIDQEAATTIGNAIISNMCGIPPPMASGTGTPWLLWGVVGIVALVGGAILIKGRG